MSEIPFEAPPEDVADQQVEVETDDVMSSNALERIENNERLGWDVEPADAFEQAIDVPMDDEGP